MATGSSGMAAPAKGRAIATAGWGTLRQREVGLGWLLLAPVLVVMLVLVVWPFTTAIWSRSPTRRSGGRVPGSGWRTSPRSSPRRASGARSRIR